MTRTPGRAKGFTEGFTTGQRTVVIIVAIALLMGGFGLSRWALQPTWAPLFGNLSGEDASMVIDELNADGVRYKIADNGATVLIPQNQVYEKRIALLGKGVPSNEDGDGWSLLDEQSITATDFQQNIAYQRAIQSELAKTLTAMNGVSAAVVNLAVPKKGALSGDADAPTSSVLLSLKRDNELSIEQVTSITHLVAGSVAGLDPDNVTVTDQAGEMLTGTGGRRGSSANDEQTAAFENRMSAAAQKVLDKVAGPGRSVVRVSAQLDFDDTEGSSKVYSQSDPIPDPLSEATVKEEYTAEGTATRYRREQRTANNSVNKKVTKYKQTPGTVQRMTVAVVLDAKIAGTLKTGKIRKLVANAVGLKPKRGDSIQVSALPFDTTTADAARKELAAATKAAKIDEYIELAKKSGLALLIVIILITVMRWWKQGSETTIDVAASDLPASDLILSPAPRALGPGQQLALPSQSTANHDQMHDKLAALVDNQPGDAAQMLHGWVAERK